ncbi:MAG: AsmA family protein, partial [Pseudomonadota bacterium]|nr:AsmA family protein [Pseudomonadota bacterium]
MKRALLVIGLMIVIIPLAAFAAAAWFLNGDAVKLRLAEQVRRMTGRELTIAGPVSLAWSLSPAIALTDVSLSNPPGFSQPQFAHLDRVDVQLAWRRCSAANSPLHGSPLPCRPCGWSGMPRDARIGSSVRPQRPLLARRRPVSLQQSGSSSQSAAFTYTIRRSPTE